MPRQIKKSHYEIDKRTHRLVVINITKFNKMDNYLNLEDNTFPDTYHIERLDLKVLK